VVIVTKANVVYFILEMVGKRAAVPAWTTFTDFYKNRPKIYDNYYTFSGSMKQTNC